MLRSARQNAFGVVACVVVIVALASLPAVAGALPDGRGYELVSPSVKNGGDVMADAGRTRASVSGNAVNFASLTPFGDVLGSGVATEYISQRTGQPGTTGWVTHGIIPPVEPLSFNGAARSQDAVYQGEFSDDLAKGVLHSYGPLTNDPNVAEVSNIYLRQDALSGGAGSYALLSACPGCSSPLSDPNGFYAPQIAGATPDLGHIVFEAGRSLTADSPPENPFCLFIGLGCNPNLYEWDHGTLRFVGILPDGSSAPISMAGIGALQRHYTLNAISSDGSKIFFTVPPDASSVDGDLYMRVDHSTTVQLNASERTDCADHNPCSGTPEPDPAGHALARLQFASPDGSKVFFSSPEQLTDASGGSLYVYDTTLPVSDPNHLRLAYADDQPADGNIPTTGVLGSSTDGSYVYFIDASAILPGQASLAGDAPNGIYLWHNGTITLVGSINDLAAGFDIADKNWVDRGLGARVTPDGRTLLFVSYSGAGLTGYDHGNTCGSASLGSSSPCAELYVYKADSGVVHCVSCNPSGAAATSDATFTVQTSTGGAQPTTHLNHPVTTDGDHVFFETGDRLLPEDVNGKKTDVYEWTALGVGDCQTTSAGFRASTGGCLALITTGTSSDDSHFLDASPSGHDVFFSTNQRLVGWDNDNNYDLYDARIGGGLPDPTPATPECVGQECQGLIAAPPPGQTLVTSSLFKGSDNVPPVVHKKPAVKRCAKGKVRKRVHGKIKCVKKPKPKRKAKAGKAARSRHT